MCWQCWENEYDAVLIDNDVTRAAAAAIDAVYEFNCVGGNLHVVLDDWNLEDEHVDGCRESIARNIHGHGPAELAAERYCLSLLKAMTVEERASALAIHSGFDRPPPKEADPDGPPTPIGPTEMPAEVRTMTESEFRRLITLSPADLYRETFVVTTDDTLTTGSAPVREKP